MKLKRILAAAALSALTTGSAFAANLTVDFEKTWDFLNGDVNGYYGGGTAADGSTGANLGITFSNVSGLSNDDAFTYYQNAPSMQGTAYAHVFAEGERAIMNIAAGATAFSLFYSSPSAVAGAVKAYSGIDGTGTLLGTLDLAANSSTSFDAWAQAAMAFSGVARSFDFTGGANVIGFDNVQVNAVPVPPALVMLAPALLGLGTLRRKAPQA